MLTLFYTGKSIGIQPSVIGYIAKSVALVGKGKTHEGYRACDIAFEHFHSSHVTILLLVKACKPCFRTWFPLSLLFCLGCRRVHGRRAWRCDITCRQPHCCRGLQLNILRGSGTFMMCYHTVASLLMFPAGIHVPSSWGLVYEEQWLRTCDTVVWARTSHTAQPHRLAAVGCLIGKPCPTISQQVEIGHHPW